MLAKVKELKKKMERVDNINRERLRLKSIKDNELNDLYTKREKIRDRIETVRFIVRSSSDYYKTAREENLTALKQYVGEFMTTLLNKEYEVDLRIERKGNYDYLEGSVNGQIPKELSGGEQQAYSLAMVSGCTTNGVLVLDETLNSFDPYALERILEYLDKMSIDTQIFLIELNGYLDIPYTFIAQDNTILRGDSF